MSEEMVRWRKPEVELPEPREDGFPEVMFILAPPEDAGDLLCEIHFGDFGEYLGGDFDLLGFKCYHESDGQTYPPSAVAWWAPMPKGPTP